MLQHFITITLAIVCLAAADHCGPKFGGKCQCGIVTYESETRYVVNCTNEGFIDTNVLEHMPEETEVVLFTGNKVPELPWNIFGTSNNYDKLTVVDMSNNHIREIRGKTFHGVQNVKRLILNHNNLSISRDDEDVNHHHPRVFSNFDNLEELHLTNAFYDNTSARLSEDLHDIFVNSNLTKLYKLHLEQNEIVSFRDRRVFCDLPNLHDLHLGDNLLREINFNVLCLRHLRFLDLERNRFSTVSALDLELLDKQNSVSVTGVKLTVDFSGNPLRCDCNTVYMQKWLQTSKVVVRSLYEMECRYNATVTERLVTFRAESCPVLSASSTQSIVANHAVLLMFLLTILVFVLIGLVGALLYVSRSHIKTIISPVLDNVSKKVQYTSIRDEECAEVHL